MTIGRFVAKNAFRNRRRSVLTVLSMAFSLLLLTLMMTIWHAFFNDQGSVQSAQRLITRHKVSLVFFLPGYYREKIRSLPGVKHVVNQIWFGGQYKDDKPENYFGQFATDPNELLQVYPEFQIPQDQVDAWKRDRAGCIVDSELVKQHGWKIGDRLFIKGVIFPVNLELTVRGVFSAPQPTISIYFNNTYLEEAYPEIKGLAGFYGVMADSPEAVTKVAKGIDAEFRNSPRPTKTESERAFQLDWIAMMGNVKAFILSICGAVMFAIMLVSANTMAMSVRSRTREVAVLKTLGFTQMRVLSMFVSESMALAITGGVFGVVVAKFVIAWLTHQFIGLGIPLDMKVNAITASIALLTAVMLGIVSGYLPAHRASRMNIVDALRHIG